MDLVRLQLHRLDDINDIYARGTRISSINTNDFILEYAMKEVTHLPFIS